MQCPKCKGEKIMWGFLPHIKDGKLDIPAIACLQCDGTGEVPEEMNQWIKDGKILKEKRIAKRITLRNMGKELQKIDNIDLYIIVMKISKMERGVIKPNMSIYNNVK